MTTYSFKLKNGLRVTRRAVDRDVAVYQLQRLGFKVR